MGGSDIIVIKLLATIIFVIFGILITLSKHTYFHELGHIMKSRKFNKDSKYGMVLYKILISDKKIGLKHRSNPLKKAFGYEVYIDKFVLMKTKRTGITFTEKNFKEFEPNQLLAIAKAGIRLQTIFGLIWCILLFSLYLIILRDLMFAIYVFGINIVLVMYYLYKTVTKKIDPASNEWPDKRIWQDPEGFYCYIRSEASKDDEKYEDFFKKN